MLTRRKLAGCAAAVLGLALVAPARAQTHEPISVVATFSILGDMVERIGGEHVELTTIVGRNGDTHVYQPTPADARAVSQAELLVVNGFQFEGWLDRLIEASDFDGVKVVATKGVDAIPFEHGDDDDHDHHAEGEDHEHEEHEEHAHEAEHEEHAHDAEHDEHHEHEEAHEGERHHHHHHGAYDPHAWQSLANAVAYIDNITAALAKASPDDAADFYRNRAAYLADIEALDEKIKKLVSTLPEDRRTVVTSHDAFQYFGRAYGLTFLAPQGISTESEPSAKDVAELIEQIKAQQIPAVFLENISDPRLLQQIADETDATVGGTLYPGALSEPDGPAPTYLDMIRHNAETLVSALTS